MGLTVVPAYGRDYKSKKAVQEDWDAGKDFLCAGLNRGYVNKEDAPKGTTVTIRYAKLTKVHLIKT
jgi:hypothetical protein